MLARSFAPSRSVGVRLSCTVLFVVVLVLAILFLLSRLLQAGQILLELRDLDKTSHDRLGEFSRKVECTGTPSEGYLLARQTA